MAAALLTLLVSVPLLAQAPRVGIIDFYGVRTLSEARLRQALAIREGDPLPKSKGDTESAIELVPGVVHARLQAACCEDGKAVLYVGIEEKGALHYTYRLPPTGEVRLPEPIHEAYARFLTAAGAAARTGETGEDLTSGHSLMHNAACREIQQEFVTLAAAHQSKLREVLRTSEDEEHRAIAAYVLGYAKRKREVVDDLQYALQDPDDTVRNNAMRALGAITVLSLKGGEEDLKVEPTWLVEMLNSLVWADRHAAAVTLVTTTESRNAGVLALLRERSLAALVEMARWKHLPHSLPSFILLGRLGGLAEKEIQDAWSRLDRDGVIRKAERKP
ncbi:MAG: HEAT repeat domain-containing protein [Bryobacteraceae bacterium]